MNFKTFKMFRKIFGKLAIKHEEKILEKADDISYYRELLEDEEISEHDMMYVEKRKRAQHDGKYAVVSFDMKDSKKGYDFEFNKLLFDEYYKELLMLEKEIGKRILHDPEEKIMPYTNGYFELGDLFSYPIEYSDERDINFFIKIFEKVKKKLNISYEYHYILLRYESDYFRDGYEMYYLLDAVKDSEELSKMKEELI